MTLTTKLEAINQMLLAIGASPVNSLDTNSNVDVAQAKTLLDDVSREFQSAGWNFNTEVDVPLTRDANKEILLAENAARVDIAPEDVPLDTEPMQRGSKLYDTKNRRYTWDEDLKAEIVYLLEWELLPEPARNFVAKSAARRFQEKVLGSEKVSQFTRDDEQRAWTNFVAFEENTGDYNVLQAPEVFAALARRVPLHFS